MRCFVDVLDVELPDPFPRMTWAEAMRRYGSDKPDLRIPLELVDDLTTSCATRNSRFFRPGRRRRPGGGPEGARRRPSLSRKQIDDLAAYAVKYGARGLAWIKVNDPPPASKACSRRSPSSSTTEAVGGLIDRTGAGQGDLLLFGAGPSMPVVRLHGRGPAEGRARPGLVEEGWKPLWVVDFPMFEFDEDDQRFYALHHPFTAPTADDPDGLRSNPAEAVSRAYDMVLNGAEIGGGSIRIHDPEMQQAVFDVLGIAEAEARRASAFCWKPCATAVLRMAVSRSESTASPP